MKRRDVTRLALRGTLAWLAISTLVFLWAQPLGQALLPPIGFVLHLAGPEYAPALTLVPQDHDHLIALSAWVLRPIVVAPGHTVPAGAELTAAVHLLHSLVPPVILLAILMAWPVRLWRHRAALLATGLVLCLLLVAAITPFQLLGTLELHYQELAAGAGCQRPESWALRWMIFCEMGGRWALPIAAGWACIQGLAGHTGRRDASGSDIDGHAP